MRYSAVSCVCGAGLTGLPVPERRHKRVVRQRDNDNPIHIRHKVYGQLSFKHAFADGSPAGQGHSEQARCGGTASLQFRAHRRRLDALGASRTSSVRANVETVQRDYLGGTQYLSFRERNQTATIQHSPRRS